MVAAHDRKTGRGRSRAIRGARCRPTTLSARWEVGLVIAVSVTLGASRAVAFETKVLGADADQAIRNTRAARHDVAVRLLARDTVLFTVTREFVPIDPSKPIALDEPIALPPLSVVTSFSVQTDGSWRKSFLRTYAPAPFEKGAQNRPWASLHWDTGLAPAIELPTCLISRTVRVRYEIWARGQLTDRGLRWQYCEHPDTGDAIVSPDFSLLSSSPELVVRHDTDADSPHCVSIERALPTPTRLTASYGVYHLGEVWWWRIESAWPRSLAPSTELLHGPVVVLLDTSRSQLKNNRIAQQIEIAKALLRRLARTQVELVLVNRLAKRVFGRFIPAADVDPKTIEAITETALCNGSFLDRGIELAAEALSSHHNPGRILVLGDGELSIRFKVSAALAQLRRAPKGTVVDLLEPRSGEANQAEVFDPSGDWIPFAQRAAYKLAAATRGRVLAVTVGAQTATEPSLDRLLSAALLGEAIEPRAWQNITLRDASRPGTPEWPPNEWPYGEPEAHKNGAESGAYYPEYLDVLTSSGSSESVAENNVVVAAGRHVWSGFSRTPPPKRLLLIGQAMGRAIRLTLEADPELNAQMPRLAASLDEIRCLAASQRTRYALAAGFLAPPLEFWVPGTNVSNEGGEISSGGGDDGCDPNAMGGWATGVGPAYERFPDVATLLKPCGIRIDERGKLEVSIETESAEILNVISTGSDTKTRACTEEAIWSLNLPEDFNHGMPATYTLHLSVTPDQD